MWKCHITDAVLSTVVWTHQDISQRPSQHLSHRRSQNNDMFPCCSNCEQIAFRISKDAAGACACCVGKALSISTALQRLVSKGAETCFEL